MAKTPTQSIVMLLVVQLMFGLFPVASKKVLPVLDPFPLLAVRIGGAALCMIIIHQFWVQNPVPMRLEWKRVTVLAFLGVIINMALFMVGLNLTTPVEAVLVITSIPVFTYAIAVLAKKEQLGPRRAIGILLAMLGVIYLALEGYRQDKAHLIGDLLVLANALSFSAFLVYSKPLNEKYDALSLTTWVFVLGAVVFIPVGLFMGLPEQLPQLQGEALLWMIFIVLGPSVVTYALNGIALRHVPSSTVGFFTYVQPIFAAIFAYLILDQHLNPRLLPAAALVFVGVWLVARRKPKILEGQVIGD